MTPAPGAWPCHRRRCLATAGPTRSGERLLGASRAAFAATVMATVDFRRWVLATDELADRTQYRQYP